MLGFKRGTAIAVVKGGNRDGQILRLYSGSIDEENAEIEQDAESEDILDGIKNPLDRLPSNFFDTFKRLPHQAVQELRKHIRKKERPPDDNEDWQHIYDTAMTQIKRSIRKEIILEGGKFMALPSEEIVERLYITAPSGAGKSTWVANWLGRSRKIWHKKSDKKDIFIFSRVADDKPLDKFKPIRIEIDEELLYNPIEAEDLQDSVAIFDDIDTISNTQLRKNVITLRDDLLECGRHYNVRMLCTSHLMLGGNTTKKMLNESTSVVFFPRSGNICQMRRFLQVYCGFEKDMIHKILNVPSRWVMVRKLYPMMVLHERGAFVVV